MKLITNNFKTHVAKQFVESLTEPQNTIYFMGAHKSLPYPSDASVPDLETDLNSSFYKTYDELLFGKHVTPSDVTHMIRNIPWVSGTVYDMYDDKMTAPETKNFYVVSKEAGTYHVFKCLSNNYGAASTIQPLRSSTSPDDELYITIGDGYQWKYMYEITASQYLKFATPSYVPLFEDPAVTANAIDGAIETIVIEDAGSLYRSYATGKIKEVAINGNSFFYSIESSDMTLSTTDGFYENCSIYINEGTGDGEIRTIVDYFVTGGDRKLVVDLPFNTTPDTGSAFIIAPRVVISGDGTNASARAIVDANTASISSVEIITRGTGYTSADIQVIGNAGTTINAMTTAAVMRAIISPPKGHGSDIINELYANRIGVSVDFFGSESSTIPTSNDYRKITLIKDPLFKKAILTVGSTVGFNAGETIAQASSGATAKIDSLASSSLMNITNIRGFFVSGNNSTIVGSTSSTSTTITNIDRSFETFDQRNIYTVANTTPGPYGNGFINDEVVIQSGLTQTQAGNLVTLTLAGTDSAYQFRDGETISQSRNGDVASATVVSRYNSILTVSNPTGYFVINQNVVGANSGASASVTNYDTTFAATAIANVHEIQVANNAGTIAVTEVNGTFLLSDGSKNIINSFKGQTSQATADLIGIDAARNKIVDGSGEIMYIENFSPITRDAEQTERIKLIIEF